MTATKKVTQIEFHSEGTFNAMYAAQRYLSEHGYSYGSNCAMLPTAFLKGDYDIAKWKNLTAKERKQVDGIMTGDFRQGPVFLKFYDGHEPQDNVIYQ
jgi:hypothetical protein